jgi:hypothetical protein
MIFWKIDKETLMFTENQIENKIDEILVKTKNAKVVHPQDYFHGISYRKECMNHTKKSGGLWLEFGVFRGRSIQHFAEMKPAEKFYGFDCFEGLPEVWDHMNPKGYFNLNGEIPPGAIIGPNVDPANPHSSTETVPWAENISLVKGYFDQTLPTFLNNHSENIDFVHFDADLYSSTKTILDILSESNRLQKDTMFMFDEICDYEDYRKHEIKAFAEFLLKTNFGYTCAVYQPSTYSQACYILE